MNEMLGKKVRCIVTGFKGIATVKVNYMNGGVRYCVKSETDSTSDGIYIDAEALEVIGEGVSIPTDSTVDIKNIYKDE